MSGQGDRFVSVLIYVAAETNRVAEMVATVREALGGREHEIVMIDDGTGRGREWLREPGVNDGPIKLVRFPKTFGESVALDATLPHLRGNRIVTLPAGLAFDADEVRSLLDGLDDGADLVIGYRSGEPGPGIDRFPFLTYRWLTRKIAGESFRDLTSGVRAFRREVAEDIALYGEMIRFFPILASGRGYRVAEIPLRGEWPKASGRDVIPRPMVYLNRVLDVLTLTFLLRFTRKPLRFYGLVGSGLLTPGALILLYLFIVRVLFSQAIAGRPLLLLGILLTVLGVQMISIGLIGEMIIFTHSRKIRDYSILEVLG